MCTEGILKGNENGGFVSADETVRKMLPYNQEYVLKEGTYPEAEPIPIMEKSQAPL